MRYGYKKTPTLGYYNGEVSRKLTKSRRLLIAVFGLHQWVINCNTSKEPQSSEDKNRALKLAKLKREIKRRKRTNLNCIQLQDDYKRLKEA